MEEDIGSECTDEQLSISRLGYLFINPDKVDACLGRYHDSGPGFFMRRFGKTRLVFEESKQQMWQETSTSNCWSVWTKHIEDKGT